MDIYVVTVTHEHLRAFNKVYSSLEEATESFNNLVSHYVSCHKLLVDRDDEYWTEFSEWVNAYTTEIRVVKSLKFRKDPRPNFAPNLIDSCIIYLNKYKV